jgi:hypothetical protein
MPPKNYKKGYVKHPDTGEWTDPRILERERQAKEQPKVEKSKVESKIVIEKKQPVKDDLGPETQPTQDNKNYAIVVVTWKDERGRDRSTQYTMGNLTINENIHEEFHNAKKKTFIHLSLEGNVIEKI